ncbi:helix-turn-helix transcriptional regulator [Brevundimonas sp. CEF1]|uniref:helix-turn-helix transcriptional regulator n=1 Tax=Brevundimonas sp. CEF1 TaxID=3442642 RepID=UPI003F514867
MVTPMRARNGMTEPPLRHRLIRISEVLTRVGVARSTLYRWIQEGFFPRQSRISHRVAVWLEADVEEWILSKRPSQGQHQIAPKSSSGPTSRWPP